MATENNLKVADFTGSVKPILEFLEDYRGKNSDGTANKLYLSDVVDKLGNQYVDLVQEGGGVHGVALAGYTYILEKMGVSFMKMAGTSAGSINTLLLSAVSTRPEMTALKECISGTTTESKQWNNSLQYDPSGLVTESYYETRSEKLVEYLAGKDLRELVDGHPRWQKLLLSLFQGAVDFKQAVSYFKRLSRWAIALLIAMLVLILFSGVLAIRSLLYDSVPVVSWTVGLSALVLLLAFIYLVRQGLWMRILYRVSARFGINPGKDFENWVAGIMVKNGINSISHLKSKLQLERECLRPAYMPRGASVGKAGSIAKESPPDSWYVRLQKVQEEVDALTNMTISTDDDQVNCSQMIGVTNYKLIQLGKAIAPDAADREVRAGKLLQLFYPVIQKQNWMNEHCTQQGEEVKTSFDKELALVCSDISNGIKVEFPAMHKMYWGEDYSISPASYVRGSMSVPFFFKPFQIDYVPTQLRVMEKEWRSLLNIDKRIETGNTCALLVDGGLLSNFPVNIFYNPDLPVPSKPTIGVRLEFEDDAQSTKIDSLSKLVGSMVNTMRYFYDRDFIARHTIFKKTVRSIDTGKVHWLNFALTEDDQVELFYRGALTAAIFLLSSTPGKDAASAMQFLVSTGKEVKYKGKVLNIYRQMKSGYFNTEDFSVEDIAFNWEAYKKDRLLHLSETQAQSNRLKRKASFNKMPDVGTEDSAKK